MQQRIFWKREPMVQQRHSFSRDAGFSLMELIIAMTITIVILGISTTMIAKSLRMRSHDNAQTDALADVQRGLNIMSREIANAGFDLSTNGIITQDSSNNSIRIISNLNSYTTDSGSASISDPNEDDKFY